MKLDDLLCDSQSQACPAAACAARHIQSVELFKDPFQLLLRDRIAMVAKLNAHGPVLLCGCNVNIRILKTVKDRISQKIVKDALAGLFMTLTGILYWCNPLVRYALKEMRSDREIACDAAVLKRLPESDYEAYGAALINFAEKVSHMPFLFAAGMSGSMKQMRQRIAAISTYEKPDAFRKAKGCTAFVLIGALLLTPAPLLSTQAAGQEQYRWNPSLDRISTLDLSSYFDGYEGSFVLYDLKNDHWHIYDMEHALLRTSPDSTYKIYDALFALEEGVITPADSSMAWNGTAYPFAAWNKDQNLDTAMRASVNWYFEKIDRQLGSPVIRTIFTGSDTATKPYRHTSPPAVPLTGCSPP